MHQRKAVFVVQVRVRIEVRLATVRSPASVRNADVMSFVLLRSFFGDELDTITGGTLASVLCDNEMTRVVHGTYTSGIVSAFGTDEFTHGQSAQHLTKARTLDFAGYANLLEGNQLLFLCQQKRRYHMPRQVSSP